MVKKIYVSILKRRFFATLIGWYGVYKFATRGPSSRAVAFMYLLTHRDMKLRERLTRQLISQPDCRQVVEDRQPIRSLQELADCPNETLGREFYKFMKANRLAYPAPPSVDFKSDFHYIIYRLLNTHDLYHVLLGMPVDSYGEMVVASFTSAQVPEYVPPAVHIASSALHVALKNHGLMEQLNLGTTLGYLLGKSTEPLFPVNWDKWWGVGIDEVRRALGIDLPRMSALVAGVHDQGRADTPGNDLFPITIFEQNNKRICSTQEHQLAFNDSTLKLRVYAPVTGPVKVVCILGRAMFTTGNYLVRSGSPSIASCFLQHGLHVLMPIQSDDPGTALNFDTMLKRTERCIEFARALYPGYPIVLVGHSLSGLDFLCAQGLVESHRQVQGIVTIGAGTWHRDLIRRERFPVRLGLKGLALLINCLGSCLGRVPARLLGIGDFNEAIQMVRQVTLRNIKDGVWQSLSGRIDYYRVLCNVSCPVLCVASQDDRIMPISLVNGLHARMKQAPCYQIHDGFGHMELAASERAWTSWQQIAKWILSECGGKPQLQTHGSPAYRHPS